MVGINCSHQLPFRCACTRRAGWAHICGTGRIACGRLCAEQHSRVYPSCTFSTLGRIDAAVYAWVAVALTRTYSKALRRAPATRSPPTGPSEPTQWIARRQSGVDGSGTPCESAHAGTGPRVARCGARVGRPHAGRFRGAGRRQAPSLSSARHRVRGPGYALPMSTAGGPYVYTCPICVPL